MQQFIDKISGNLCYFNNFSISDISGNNAIIMNSIIKTIKNNLNIRYHNLHYSSENCEVLQDLKTAQDFLYPNGLQFKPERIVISDYKISHEVLPITGSSIMLTIFPEIGTASFSINLNFKDATTEQVIFLKQCSGGPEKFKIESMDGETKYVAIKEVFSSLVKAINVPCDAFNKNCLIELNKFGQSDEVKNIINSEAKRLYGILTGDEGWEFVGEELAKDRISQNWGSREFVKFIAFGSNYMLINLNKEEIAQKYEIHQDEYTQKHYGGKNEYFSLKSSFAGINHGILFSVETVMAIKTVAKYILDKQTSFRNQKIQNFNLAIKRTQSYRKDLMLTLNKLQEIDFSELGELENLVLRSQHIDPIIEKIKYLLELLESELTLMYSERTNKLVNILTIFGLCFTVIQTAISIYSLF